MATLHPAAALGGNTEPDPDSCESIVDEHPRATAILRRLCRGEVLEVHYWAGLERIYTERRQLEAELAQIIGGGGT